MKYNPEIHHRRSIRLQGYDYSQEGAYFVTLCAQHRECLFGKIVDGEMVLNDAGRVVVQSWQVIPDHFPSVELDEFVVMPNHVHGILVITNAPVGANDYSPIPKTSASVRGNEYSPIRAQRPRGTSKTIGSIIRGFKIGVTKWMRQSRGVNFSHRGCSPAIWQRNYYERIIRNEDELHRIREYIVNNPLKWEFDRENPVGAGLKQAPARKNE